MIPIDAAGREPTADKIEAAAREIYHARWSLSESQIAAILRKHFKPAEGGEVGMEHRRELAHETAWADQYKEWLDNLIEEILGDEAPADTEAAYESAVAFLNANGGAK